MRISLARVLLAVLGLSSAACTKKSPVPEQVPGGTEGGHCDYGCNPGLACTPKSRVCAKPDHPEHVAKRQADVERERAYLAQSGVEAPAHAEQPPATPPPAEAPAAGTAGPAASGAVRVVRTSTGGKGAWVIAACRADERLVGGGCTNPKHEWTAIPSYPSGESPTDTLGARWNCGSREATHDAHIEAFALCQRP